MKKLAWILFSLISAASFRADAVEINVGGTRLDIPAPEGFAPVTPKMARLDKFLDALVPPTNLRFAVFIPEGDIAAATAGEMPQLTRYFVVQIPKQVVELTLTKSDFVEMKDIIRKQNDQLAREAEKQIPSLISDMSKKNLDAGTLPELKSVNMVPYAPHDESDRSLSYSMIVNYQMAAGMGGTEKMVSLVTSSLVHVKGKLLLLYCYGGPKDLAWGREASKTWVQATITGNPSDAATEERENKVGGRGFDWHRVGRGALIGAAAGLCIGLLRMIGKKRDSAK